MLKINELIKGKWYKFKDTHLQTHYFSFVELRNNTIFYSDEIIYDEFRNISEYANDGWFYNRCEYSEAYFKDIVKYLPDSHIDKKTYIRKQKITKLLC